MSDFIVPEGLQKGAEEWDFKRWVVALPERVAECADKWSLRVFDPYQPGGGAGWVAPVELPDGSVAVLKVGWRHPEAEYEAEGLRAWDGHGAVRLFDDFKTDDTCVLLLERCIPGTTLRSVAGEPEQDEVIARIFGDLWIESPVDTIPALSDLTDIWSIAIERGLAAKRARLDPGQARAAIDVFQELSRDAHDRVLLCTDLHADNVLSAERDDWLVVDPKPYVGDRAYDPVQHVLNCLHRAAADPIALVERLATLCGVDARRLGSWVFARCVSEIAGEWFDEAARVDMQQIADALAP